MRKINFSRRSSISWPNPMFDHLLESSQWDDSNKWSYIGFVEEIDIIEITMCTLSGVMLPITKAANLYILVSFITQLFYYAAW